MTVSTMIEILQKLPPSLDVGVATEHQSGWVYSVQVTEDVARSRRHPGSVTLMCYDERPISNQ